MKAKKIYEEFSIIMGAIIIGIPLGLFVGIVCWIKFPFAVYREARAKLAIKRIQEAKEFLEKHGQTQKTQDIWEKHIQRMEEKKYHDNWKRYNNAGRDH